MLAKMCIMLVALHIMMRIVKKAKNNYYLWMLKASQEGTTPLYLKKLHDLKMIFRPFGAKKLNMENDPLLLWNFTYLFSIPAVLQTLALGNPPYGLSVPPP